ncbi:MAG: hypothetical protein ACI9WU_002687 [Myxococcota bacterium]|jgi:hypothetical protein
MADDSALRATLRELKVAADSDEARRPSDSPARTASPVGSGGGGSSLLADLLAETSGEAQRELEQIKKQLSDKKAAQEAEHRKSEDLRRDKLDILRQQEAERREAMIRQRNGLPDPVPEAVVEQAAAPVAVAPPPKKGSPLPWIFAALLLVGAGGAAWFFLFSGQSKPLEQTDARAKALVVDQQADVALQQAVAARNKLDAERKVEAAAKVVADERAALAEMTLDRPEPEADGYPRRMLDLGARVPTPVAKARSGKSSGKKPGTKRSGGGKRIKIRGLDLGGSR